MNNLRCSQLHLTISELPPRHRPSNKLRSQHHRIRERANRHHATRPASLSEFPSEQHPPATDSLGWRRPGQHHQPGPAGQDQSCRQGEEGPEERSGRGRSRWVPHTVRWGGWHPECSGIGEAAFRGRAVHLGAFERSSRQCVHFKVPSFPELYLPMLCTCHGFSRDAEYC